MWEENVIKLIQRCKNYIWRIMILDMKRNEKHSRGRVSRYKYKNGRNVLELNKYIWLVIFLFADISLIICLLFYL